MVTTIFPSVFLSKCESRLRDERASKDPEDTSFAHTVSGNSLHNFALENPFVCNEIAGVGRTPWRSMATKRCRDPSTRTSLSQAQGRARSGRQRDNVFSQTETLPFCGIRDENRPLSVKS